MIVVSDNGPAGFLVQIERVEFLHSLYGQLIIPTAVRVELSSDGTPKNIRDWVQSAPNWLEVKSPLQELEFKKSGRGEREAIQIAK